ncbi:PREDICTED: probable L-type lectin-domain containing receptor kinase II.1 [Camelina sativa]|uniref:non-specific serine/threonine protein kinase n=1 Tax=Camelina sativa TaxID=90675 RepID=A0ABM1QNI5_CAMSA|nr:PREDICTED: probable L-type lectin-domain containing receptor kinase II.1 [Camelina sativa]
MAGVLGSVGFWIMIGIHVTFLVFAQEGDQFVHYDFRKANLELDGMANTDGGPLQLTNNTNTSTGHAFHKNPIKFTTSTLSSFSFSTEFVFAIFPLQSHAYGHGMAFVVSPTKDLSSNGTANSGLGIFNRTNDNNSTNHILAVELDTHESSEQLDKSNNHVGIDIYSIVSVKSEEASYFNATEGKNTSLLLASGKSILIWIDYDGTEQLLNVTLAPVPTPKPVSPLLSKSIKPSVPLLSRSINLSEIFNETMYVGFSGSTGTIKSDQYILGWSFKKGRGAESLDISMISDPPPSSLPPTAPPTPSPPPSSPRPQSPPPSSGGKKSSLGAVLGTSIATVALILIILGGIVYLYKKKKYSEVLEQWEKEYNPQRYSFRNLYKATKGFRENHLLGAGGFGKVYKGILPSGTQIAVKRVYHDAEQGMKQYVAEIASMGRLRHKNLVQLLGYCRRKGELLLVYDYMPNGSLDDYLFNKNKLKDLTWSQRVNIIKGVASALLYLHEEWEQVVLHRDIKASNILLDADLNGRLGDFGLARFHDRGVNLEATRVVGTIGYMAPELTAMGVTTTWTDVYAFGAFILEVVCGRRPVDPDAPREQVILVKWVASCGRRDALTDTVDSKLIDFKVGEVKQLLKLGMLCSQSNPENRPSMRQILQYLEGNVSVPGISLDNVSLGIPNISHEKVTQMTTTSTSANFSFEDVTILFGGR